MSLTTLGPAKAIRAFGSAMLMSPNMAYDAVVPPVVGSVHREMKGNLASANCASFAAVLPFALKKLQIPSYEHLQILR